MSKIKEILNKEKKKFKNRRQGENEQEEAVQPGEKSKFKPVGREITLGSKVGQRPTDEPVCTLTQNPEKGHKT